MIRWPAGPSLPEWRKCGKKEWDVHSVEVLQFVGRSPCSLSPRGHRISSWVSTHQESFQETWLLVLVSIWFNVGNCGGDDSLIKEKGK
jgi:hypothetical protein